MADWLDSDEDIKAREEALAKRDEEHPELAFGGNFKSFPKEEVHNEEDPLSKAWDRVKSNYSINSQVPDSRPFAPLLGEDTTPQETQTPVPQNATQQPLSQAQMSPPAAPAAPVGPPGGRGSPRVSPQPQMGPVTPAEPVGAPAPAAPAAPPEAPRPPSALEQLLASREQDREELRAAQAESERRRNGALGLNAVRAGLAQMTGQAPDTEAERLQLENADAPVKNVLARQKSDQEFQQQAMQALEMDQKRDSQDPHSPMSLRATMLAKSSGLIPSSHPGITAAEWQMAQQGGNFQELVAKRKTEELAEKAKAARETAQTAEDVRKDKAHEAIEWANVNKEKTAGANQRISDRVALTMQGIPAAAKAFDDYENAPGPVGYVGNVVNPGGTNAVAEGSRETLKQLEAKVKGGKAEDYDSSYPKAYATPTAKKTATHQKRQEWGDRMDEANDFYQKQGKPPPFDLGQIDHVRGIEARKGNLVKIDGIWYKQ